MYKKIVEIMKIIETLTERLDNKLSKDDYYIEDLGCPHQWPKTLPAGYCAVYFYAYNKVVLKIGKANSKSKSRYTSQHYRLNAKSTLAKSLLSDPDFLLNKEGVKSWMLTNLHRINILIKDKNGNGKAVTELVESILHYYFRPKYEGAIH